MVLLEAQSSGVPIIAFDCPTGPRNIITNNHDGVLAEYDDQEMFVDKLLGLVSNEAYRVKIAKNGFLNSKQYAIDEVMAIWDRDIINK